MHFQIRPDGKRKIFSGASLPTYMATIPWSPAPQTWPISGLRRDAARNDIQILEAIAVQLFAQTSGGDQCCECAVMELAQISGDRLVEKAHAVMLAVAVEIGMKSGRNRQLQFDRRRKCRPAERPLRHDVDDIRAFQPPQLQEPALGGKSDLQPMVAHDRDARLEHFLEPRTLRRAVRSALPRAN